MISVVFVAKTFLNRPPGDFKKKDTDCRVATCQQPWGNKWQDESSHDRPVRPIGSGGLGSIRKKSVELRWLGF